MGTVGELRALTREPAVTYLEENKRLRYHGDTSCLGDTLARGAGAGVRRALPGRATRVVDGTGVGVAIVDSGINGTHPDLTNRVQNNFKIVCTTPGLISTATGQCFGPLLFVDAGNTASTDTASGRRHARLGDRRRRRDVLDRLLPGRVRPRRA